MVKLLCCLAVAVSTQAGARPTHPDFSGEWVLVSPANPASNVPTSLVVGQPITDKNVYDAPMTPAYLELIVERRFPEGARSEKYLIGVEGGMFGFGSPSAPIQTRALHSVKWIGDSLVMTTSNWSGPSNGDLALDSERSEAWQFDSDGRLVITIAERTGGRESQTKLTYRPWIPNAIASAPADVFAIYLVADPVDGRITAYGRGEWSQLKLAAAPLITGDDLISYEWSTHTMRLRREALARIPRPPVQGTPFVVVANGQRVYLGAFVTIVSSMPFAVPTISIDAQMVDPAQPADTLVIQPAYPSPSFSVGTDPRGDERIKKALTGLGKIRGSS